MMKKRIWAFVLMLPLMSCGDKFDPTTDAEKVCDCMHTILDNPDSELDCTELINKMGDRYKDDEGAQMEYTQAYEACKP